MEIHNHNLNIDESTPDDLWKKLVQMYFEMPHWYGFVDGCPQWYGQEKDERMINASVEPSGLQFYAKLPQQEWELWFALFKNKASQVLGFEVGEPEDGFDFHIYER